MDFSIRNCSKVRCNARVSAEPLARQASHRLKA